MIVTVLASESYMRDGRVRAHDDLSRLDIVTPAPGGWSMLAARADDDHDADNRTQNPALAGLRASGPSL